MKKSILACLFVAILAVPASADGLQAQNAKLRSEIANLVETVQSLQERVMELETVDVSTDEEDVSKEPTLIDMFTKEIELLIGAAVAALSLLFRKRLVTWLHLYGRNVAAAAGHPSGVGLITEEEEKPDEVQ